MSYESFILISIKAACSKLTQCGDEDVFYSSRRDRAEPSRCPRGGHTNNCVIRQQGNNFKCSRGNDTVNLEEPLVAYWSLKSEGSPNCPQEQLVCILRSHQWRDKTGSFMFRVWIKMQRAFCMSLTVLSCTDLRCSFDPRVVVNVQVKQSEGVSGALPFEAVVQNTFYLPPSVWEQVDCPKPQLEPRWVQRKQNGSNRQNLYQREATMQEYDKKNSRLRWNMLGLISNMGLITGKTNLQLLHESAANKLSQLVNK